MQVSNRASVPVAMFAARPAAAPAVSKPTQTEVQFSGWRESEGADSFKKKMREVFGTVTGLLGIGVGALVGGTMVEIQHAPDQGIVRESVQSVQDIWATGTGVFTGVADFVAGNGGQQP